MTPEQEHRAEEAKNLLGNDLFAELLTQVRTDALVGLADVDADNIKEVLRLQAIAHCTLEVRMLLEAVILQTGEQDGGMTA